jgi:hypothetical protein
LIYICAWPLIIKEFRDIDQQDRSSTKIGNKSKRDSTPGYKDDDLAGRLQKAASARLAILEKFRSKPAADDPGEIQRRADRQQIINARNLRTASRNASRAAEEARKSAESSAREAADQAQRLAHEQQDAAKGALQEAKQKAKRDARYAARKQRKTRAG